ncbi:hypothetical protein F9L69_06320 [Brucella melitensis]|uniref:Uncharacterized protein n=2 Tax=Brucella melitensis TaxID=29459 RepID=C0RFN2_BRUMB|nr:Hypothetical protein, conserved [Brucella melitensis ATCC 23457]AQQ56231.1 hypothetical protein ADS42_003535 [Brucella melitensis]EEZ10654.1 predicted protein [Brucella melitensis bv. 3 str. Ether]EEZ15375.1 predicted protein [Brucella melitensis bv. 1 str. Rev.1]EEZ17144.1 predicted protein [Brucella melitensis bv. 2 str. 63/9]RTQ42704.1 hypothetical protein EJW28_02960 [Brucella abortus]
MLHHYGIHYSPNCGIIPWLTTGYPVIFHEAALHNTHSCHNMTNTWRAKQVRDGDIFRHHLPRANLNI